MGRRIFSLATLGAVFLVLVTAPGEAAGPILKLGDEAPSFTLPSSQDRLVDYYRDYYGKHNLVITFFPAAFTPV